MIGTINLSEKLATFDQHWLPRTVALRVGACWPCVTGAPCHRYGIG
jgi:hypothetical protein